MLNYLWNEWSIRRSSALWILLLATAADIGLSILAFIIVAAAGTGHAVATMRDNVAGYWLLWFPVVCLITLVAGWWLFARHSDAHSVILALVPVAYLLLGFLVVVLMSFAGN